MLQTIIQKAKSLVRNPIPAVVGAVAFLSAAHHLVNFWEHSLGWMAVAFVVAIPFFILMTGFLWDKTASQSGSISRNRLLILSIGALLAGGFIAWRVYKVPASYHSLTIIPRLSGSETIGLLEVKANYRSLSLHQIALENKWKEANSTLYATSHSQPLTISFSSKANVPVTVLFQVSPQSGSVRLSLDSETMSANLSESTAGIRLIQWQSKYRRIPNWLFIPGLVLVDVITFGVLILFLLMMQEIGQREVGAFSPKDADNLSVHRRNLLALILLGLIIHLLNALATPLIIGPDSPSCLEGSVYLLKFGSLDGVPNFRGPGTTFLFAPVMYLFGRNPWGIKVLLHLIALACIPVSYRMGWQVCRNHWVAFLSGLLAAFSPDLLFYSNFVMSDAPNIFLVLAFITLLISALESVQIHWLISALLVGSCAVLLRPENIVMLGIGLFFLLASAIWDWLRTIVNAKVRFIHIGLSFAVALLPILWWSAHNLRVYGFFGMSNYQGEVFYDGWVYSGDASHLSFSDPNSPAIKTINNAVNTYPAIITDKSGVATGWEIYPSLLKAGYTPAQTFDLLQSAAWDSIKGNPELALKLLLIKYRAGLRPEITFNITYPLPGEPTIRDEEKAVFFDPEQVNLAALVMLQRQINTGLIEWYPYLYPFWILFCLLLVFISLFRSPGYTWGALAAVTISRIFIPLTIGVALWRYALAGWLPAQIIAVSGIWILVCGSRIIFRVNPNHSLT